MSKLIKELKSGKYNNAWIAVRLYPDTPEKTAISKLHNKLNGVQGRSLSADELKTIKTILK